MISRKLICILYFMHGLFEWVKHISIHTSFSNSHTLWSFDPMLYLGANYLMVQLTVEQVDMATNVCF